MDPKKFVLLHQTQGAANMSAGMMPIEKEQVPVEELESWGKITWRRFCQNKVAVYSLIILIITILMQKRKVKYAL